MSDAWREVVSHAVAVRQAYLARGPVKLRARTMRERGYLMVKCGVGIERFEIEREITFEEATDSSIIGRCRRVLGEALGLMKSSRPRN